MISKIFWIVSVVLSTQVLGEPAKFEATLRGKFFGAYSHSPEEIKKSQDSAAEICKLWRERADAVISQGAAISTCNKATTYAIYRFIPVGTSALDGAVKAFSLLIGENYRTHDNPTRYRREMLGYVTEVDVFVALSKGRFSGHLIKDEIPASVKEWMELPRDEVVRRLYSRDAQTEQLCKNRVLDFERGGEKRLVSCSPRLQWDFSGYISTLSYEEVVE